MGRRIRTIVASSLFVGTPTAERPVRVLSEAHTEATLISVHSHTDHIQLLVPVQGVIRLMSERSLWIVPPGRAMVIPPRLHHSMIASNRVLLRVVSVHPSALSSADAMCRVVSMSRVATALVDAIGASQVDYPLGSADARLVDVFLDQLRSARSKPFHIPRPGDPRARSIADALVAEPGSQLTLSEWGKEFGASQRTLARLFEAETGMGFRDYRRQVQIHTAMGMLEAGVAISEVASDLGYESASAFIYAFRKTMGMTPGQFAKLHRTTYG